MTNKAPTTIFKNSFSEEIWDSTYQYYKDDNVDDTMYRVARGIAEGEYTEEAKKLWTEEFFEMLSEFKGTTGGRIYANAGTESKGTTLFNCISGETLVQTDNGLIRADEIPQNKIINVLTENSKYEPSTWNSYGQQSLYKVIFNTGDYVYATDKHEWVVTIGNGKTKKTTTLDLVGNNIPLIGNDKYEYLSDDEYIKGIQNGLMFGDGYVYTHLSLGEKFSKLPQFGDSRHLIQDYFGHCCIAPYNGDDEGMHYVNGLPPELKEVPIVENHSMDYLRGFIAGAIGADGCVDSRGSVSLFSANYDKLTTIRNIASHCGLPSISLRLERSNIAYDGTEKMGSNLWKLTFVKKFFQNDEKLIIKNAHKEKMQNSPVSKNKTSIKCISVEETDRFEEVYCCEQESTHTFTIENGILTGNCFVGGLTKDPDSIEGIMTHLKWQSKTLCSEGGWGENFSYIRPRGAFIHGINVESPGVVKFMEMFDSSSDVITSGSGLVSKNPKAKKKIRKGAQMAILSIWHPSIFEFISAKQNQGKLTKFNMSVDCSDEFMQKIIKVKELQSQLNDDMSEEDLMELKAKIAEEDKWDLVFPDTQDPQYKQIWDGDIQTWKSAGGKIDVYETVSATDLWNAITDKTYNRAEPGILFLDRANALAPATYHPEERLRASNPCAEQIMSAFSICCLGSINLTQMLNDNFTDFDYDKVARTAKTMVRFLDNVNNVSKTPLPQYDHSRDHKRRIGVGVLGWGSALLMLKTKFASPKALELQEKLMSLIARSSYEASIDLAIERGMYTNCIPAKHAEEIFVKRLNLSDEYMEKLRTTGIRNSSILSIQPTGNTGIFANNVSGGLEPVFMHEYIRTVIVNSMPDDIAHACPKWYQGEWYETEIFKKAKEGDEDILKGVGPDGTVYKIDVNRGLTKEVLCEDYGVAELKKRGEWNPDADWASSTMDLSVQDHLNDMSGFAKYIDSSMSKTINVPNDYSFEDFQNVYLDGYKTGNIRGITTYRDGSMTSVLSAAEEKTIEGEEEIILDDVKLPESSPAEIKILRAEGKKYYVTTSFFPETNRPFAMFVKSNYIEKSVVADEAVELLIELAESKGIPSAYIQDQVKKMVNDNNINKVARAISLCLRHGVLIRNIVLTLEKSETAVIGSFTHAIKRHLLNYVKDGETVEVGDVMKDTLCGEACSGIMKFEAGCAVCTTCGLGACN